MWSYDRHKQHEMELAEKTNLPSCYSRPNSVDAWRHRRMLESILPVLRHSPEAKWLTVGDGGFGSDAFFLQSHGIDVLATSISTHTLEVAHSRGLINKYAEENAECFSLPDNAVDFVLCKESFHHFPRPALAFYEMLRIARRGIALIEPAEGPPRPLATLKAFVKRLLRRDVSDQFEPSGNFIYRVSIRETSKMLTALGYRHLAWKGINDFWYPPFAAADFGKMSLGAVGTRLGIAVQDLLAQARLLNHGLAALICFKEQPAAKLMANLKQSGFVLVNLPQNPYFPAIGNAGALVRQGAASSSAEKSVGLLSVKL
jgi:ubiquinone/menaquinone biosynthesis C-methylase UbiE